MLDKARYQYAMVGTLLLLAGLLFKTDLSSALDWVQIAGVFFGYVYLTKSIAFVDARYAVWPVIWRIVLALAVLLIWFYLNRIIAIYLIGCIYFAVFFIFWLIRPLHQRDMLTQTTIISVLIAITLSASPITISRIVINLSNLPVPSKFELHSNADAARRHHASKSYPVHSINPLSIRLSADNLTLGETMPELQFQTRRDTLFPIVGIQYDFLQVTAHRIKGEDLHQIKLSDRSDDVILEKVPSGITINNIGADESAWLKLPDLDSVEPPVVTRIQVLALKMLIWILICFGFWRWTPITSNT